MSKLMTAKEACESVKNLTETNENDIVARIILAVIKNRGKEYFDRWRMGMVSTDICNSHFNDSVIKKLEKLDYKVTTTVGTYVSTKVNKIEVPAIKFLGMTLRESTTRDQRVLYDVEYNIYNVSACCGEE